MAKKRSVDSGQSSSSKARADDIHDLYDGADNGIMVQTKNRLPPEGSRCRFTYANNEYVGTIADGRIEIDDVSGSFGSFSAASVNITKTSRNGWLDWSIFLPDSDYWVLADIWRAES